MNNYKHILYTYMHKYNDLNRDTIYIYMQNKNTFLKKIRNGTIGSSMASRQSFSTRQGFTLYHTVGVWVLHGPATTKAWSWHASARGCGSWGKPAGRGTWLGANLFDSLQSGCRIPRFFEIAMVLLQQVSQNLENSCNLFFFFEPAWRSHTACTHELYIYMYLVNINVIEILLRREAWKKQNSIKINCMLLQKASVYCRHLHVKTRA